MPKTIDIECQGYSVKADMYEGSTEGPVVLWLIGRTSYRKKKHYPEAATYLAEQFGMTSLVLDYSGHGDSPGDINEIYPAQHFIEAITAFDWLREQFPGREFIVIGSSYGGFMATQLTKYRSFDKLILRAPAIYRPGDFYTPMKLEDRPATMAFRRDVELLAIHPLLARASKFSGKTLLLVHEEDANIPTETTDAYAKAFKAKVVLCKDLPHSVEHGTPEQYKAYFDTIYNWLTD